MLRWIAAQPLWMQNLLLWATAFGLVSYFVSLPSHSQRLSLFARLYPPDLNNLVIWQIQRVTFLKFFYLVASGLLLFAIVSATDSYGNPCPPTPAVIVASSLALGVWGSLALYLRLSLEKSSLHRRLAGVGPTWAEAVQVSPSLNCRRSTLN